jgi:Flp pilus assembly protein TadD
MRAICYRKTGEFETAAELYRRLLKETPEKEELLRPYIYCLEKSGRKERAADTAEQAVQYLSHPSVSLCLIAGVLRFKEGKMESALAHFRRATSTDPKDWRGFYNIGEIYRRQGMDGFARRFLQQAETLRSGTAGYTANQ